mmetsp:Transcript_14415/g.58794  ORF Transcript_14415/g.58794 Transcript_14415/m.58794 type:complete len:84 (-) Transcript_14415:1868-2119(-)
MRAIAYRGVGDVVLDVRRGRRLRTVPPARVVAPGQRLGVKMYNSPELVIAMVGFALAGNDVETAKTADDLLEVQCRGTWEYSH